MTDPKKVRKEEEEESDDECIVEDMGSDEEGEEQQAEDMEINEEIQVDFEGFKISDNDFHGIRQMLQQLFPKDNIDTSELTNLILKQNFIGTVLKQSEPEEDMSDDSEDIDEVFGVTTCLSFNGTSQPSQALHQLKTYLLERSKKYAGHEKIAKVLDTPKEESCIGWIINERFINIPPQVSLPMFEKLSSEIAEAGTRKHKNQYNFSYYFMICKTYDASTVPSNGDKKTAPKKMQFINTEEELFFDEATASFSYPVEGAPKLMAGRWDEDAPEMQPHRTVMLLAKDSLPKVMKELKRHLDLSAAK